MRFLLVYATRDGHTGRIAQRIATTMRETDVEVDVVELRLGGDWPYAADYDATVVGASVHAGHHQPQVVEWARENATALTVGPSAFFSVSLAAADDDAESVAAVRSMIDDVLDDTGWTPRLVEPIAGALEFREYDPFIRTLMRLISRHHGGPTDVTRDVVLTDWAAVDAFARRCAALVDGASTVHSPEAPS